jgi:hypothetical protein
LQSLLQGKSGTTPSTAVDLKQDPSAKGKREIKDCEIPKEMARSTQ